MAEAPLTSETRRRCVDTPVCDITKGNLSLTEQTREDGLSSLLVLNMFSTHHNALLCCICCIHFSLTGTDTSLIIIIPKIYVDGYNVEPKAIKNKQVKSRI